MFRRLLTTVFALLALGGLLPGAREVVEHLGEWVEHGHLAHSEPGENDPYADEHGCSPIQHRCPCHEGQSVAVYALSAGANWSAEWLTWTLPRVHVRAVPPLINFVAESAPLYLSRANAPPTPPPNA